MAWTAPSTFVAGAILTAAQLNTNVRDNSLAGGPIYATTAARDAAIPTPFAGQQAFISGTKIAYQYTGAAWVEIENIGAWTTYTPILTNIAVGTGGSAKNEGRYIRLGGLVTFEIQIVLGTSGGSVPSGAIGATLPPITQQAAARGSFSARMRDAGTAIYTAMTDNTTIGRVDAYAVLTSGTYGSGATPSSTIPFTWAAGDEVFIWGFYEAAA